MKELKSSEAMLLEEDGHLVLEMVVLSINKTKTVWAGKKHTTQTIPTKDVAFCKGP